jgi:hypothetical protein
VQAWWKKIGVLVKHKKKQIKKKDQGAIKSGAGKAQR